MIDTASILAALRSVADDPLFARIEVLDLTRSLIKARLYLREDLFISHQLADRFGRATSLRSRSDSRGLA